MDENAVADGRNSSGDVRQRFPRVQGGPALGVPAMAKVTGYALSFSGGDTAAPGLRGHIPDLREITSQPVDPDHLAADTRKKLVSRVTLGAGRITRVAPGDGPRP